MARSRSSSVRRKRRHSSTSSSSKSHEVKKTRRGRSRSQSDRRHKSRSPSIRKRRRVESESPRRFGRLQWEQRRNDFPPPGNRAWFTPELKEEIFALGRELEKVKKTVEQLNAKVAECMKVVQSGKGETSGGRHKKSQVEGHSKEVEKEKNQVSPSELKAMIDKALESTLPRSKEGETSKMGNAPQGVTATERPATEEGNMEKLVSEMRRDVNEIKLMKYDLAAVKGTLKKINEPTRTCTPHVSSTVNPNMYHGSMMIGAPTSVHVSRGAPTRSAPSRSILGRPALMHPENERTKLKRTTRISRAKRNINFRFEPIMDSQLLRLQYTDLQDLCKIHDIKYKDKPQAISALRQVPGLV
ncbi:hypothetical protein CBR_g41414 [Chara braunii]|uniref:Uncharacterized protein n=1 Tax=Chara braunii TaxID=69332 RepID=A0A388LVS3_CHABU|nr:hypothetical protein CBR_g41414 [Chara braunii]|eukprot:GBG86418.1 hypothetical protein CBR_g41414 [Chara braunii]